MLIDGEIRNLYCIYESKSYSMTLLTYLWQMSTRNFQNSTQGSNTENEIFMEENQLLISTWAVRRKL